MQSNTPPLPRGGSRRNVDTRARLHILSFISCRRSRELHPRCGEPRMATSSPTIRFTIGQYDQMIAAGVLANPVWSSETGQEGPRVELFEGEIVMMSPIGPRHEDIVDRLNAWSSQSISPKIARVRIQHSLAIPGRQSVPQPDVAWVRPRDYAASRPEAADALLVIEVAETSLRHDLEEKAAVYSAGGIPEYWVVDAVAETVHVLRSPGPKGYAEHRVASRGERIVPIACPDVSLSIDTLFGSRI